ncbi:hypothetical protein D9615_009843 [Tricholomella constricta]|uniref:C2 domain-containing protein n=1 Tax=Tricholomella constricta TaxID=117010 RepID=A0A8H5LWZ8_9AGAR|nr:hypothetical protein D9615_009843 [Tricholomella constricta]
MEPSTSPEKIQITVVEATALPRMGARTPYCKVSITIGSDRKVTQRVKRANPVWNKAFLFVADPGSQVSIQVLHGKHSKVVAEAVTSVKSEHLQVGTVAFDEIVPLNLLVSSFIRRNPTIKLSFSVALPKDVRAPQVHESTTAGPTLQNLEAISSEASTRSPPKQKYCNIIGNLKQFVNLGSAIAEVHPYAKAVWALLTSGLTVLIAQYERNARIQDLWACVHETLDFMKDAEALRDVQSLTGTVQAMMEQLRECIIYLTGYWERSTAEAMVKVVFSEEDDTIIRGITDTFAQLKVQFDQRINIQQWKIIQATGEQVAMISNKIDVLVRREEDRQLKDLLATDLHTHWSSTCLSVPLCSGSLVLQELASPVLQAVWLKY